MTTTRIGALLGCALFLFPATAAAQLGDFLKKKVEEQAKQKAGQAIDESGNKAYQEAKKAPTAGKKDEAPAAAPGKPSPPRGGRRRGEGRRQEGRGASGGGSRRRRVRQQVRLRPRQRGAAVRRLRRDERGRLSGALDGQGRGRRQHGRGGLEQGQEVVQGGALGQRREHRVDPLPALRDQGRSPEEVHHRARR